MAVRMLLPLTLRECEGVRGDGGRSPSCFLFEPRPNLRAGPADVGGVGMLDVGFEGGVGLKPPVGDTGEVTGVDDAIVPPIPALEVGGMILSGAFRVIEQALGETLVVGVMRAGLWGEPMAITNGMLELEVALSLRSEMGSMRGAMFPASASVGPTYERSIPGVTDDTAFADISADVTLATCISVEAGLILCGTGNSIGTMLSETPC